jgi:hypothetical protein
MSAAERDGRCDNCDHTVKEHPWFGRCVLRASGRLFVRRCRCKRFTYAAPCADKEGNTAP